MADKLTQLVTAAVARAAADPGGAPLFATKSAAGLFPATAAGKPAAKRAVDDGLLTPAPGPDGKAGKETYAATPKGLRFLLAHESPRQVLEDFVRAVEARQAQVDDLLATARRMADGLAGLKAAVAAVLAGLPPAADRNGTHAPAPPPAADLPAAVVARLADWAATAQAGHDCPLPDLYRRLGPAAPPTVGPFHDALRHLHAAGQVYLHPWTGPLYTLPEPPFALLVGHEVAYYASLVLSPSS